MSKSDIIVIKARKKIFLIIHFFDGKRMKSILKMVRELKYDWKVEKYK